MDIPASQTSGSLSEQRRCVCMRCAFFLTVVKVGKCSGTSPSVLCLTEHFTGDCRGMHLFSSVNIMAVRGEEYVE